MEQIWLSLTLSNFISQGLSSLDPTKRSGKQNSKPWVISFSFSIPPEFIQPHDFVGFSEKITRVISTSFITPLLLWRKKRKEKKKKASDLLSDHLEDHHMWAECTVHHTTDLYGTGCPGVSTNVSRCVTNTLHFDIQMIPGPHSYRPHGYRCILSNSHMDSTTSLYSLVLFLCLMCTIPLWCSVCLPI